VDDRPQLPSARGELVDVTAGVLRVRDTGEDLILHEAIETV